MKLGTYNCQYDRRNPVSLTECLEVIQKIGFDFAALGYPDLEEGVRFCQKIGLPVENVHLSCRGTSKIWLDGDEGDAIVEGYCEQIKHCVEFGVMTGIAHVTYGLELDPPSEKGRRRYQRIVECAEKNNFHLCVENSRASEHLPYVMEHFKSPNVHFCYDSGHDLGMGYDTEYLYDYLNRYGDRLGALHIHDSIKGFDMHVVPFDGAIDWERVTADLAKTAYGREKLCAEPGGMIYAIKEGKSAEELRATYADMAIANDERFMRFYDGYYTAYEGMPIDEYYDRYLQSMKKLAAMIEKANK